MNRALKSVVTLAVGVFVSSIALGANAPVSVFEDFRFDPLARGWSNYGETNLFAWNATNQNLEVTWDSSRPNSYFYKRLTRALSRSDDISLYFDFRLQDIAIGTTTNKPYTFQMAIGLLNFQDATNGGFLRGTGVDSPNLFEFDYFPDSGFGASISPTIISSNHQFATTFVLREITTNDLFRVIMRLNQEDDNVSVSVYRNDETYAEGGFAFAMDFTSFTVDTIAVMSYSDEGQFPDFAGSILAHGTVDNLIVTTGDIAIEMGLAGRFENGNWRMDFDTLPGWAYFVESTVDFADWMGLQDYTSMNYGRATVIHTNPPPAPPRFYRVRGTRL
ncbi:MAG TPA: hypothetical protein VNT99_02720 [Methylomirabilota bacterium]|nr:hypothetical protein [Methylomirabilota bacterium]